MQLKEFLEHKTLYYDKIDYDIIKKSWAVLSTHIKLPYIIHIIGTNGKGSTGRFLSSFLSQSGFKTLHYSSPHIKEFNERIWLNGADIDNQILEEIHNIIFNILPQAYLDKLTYFEYTTLLALYASNDIDYLVLEAGLGGEFDATNVVDNDLTILTSIGMDHQNFLGNTIEEITLTKIKSCDKKILISEQKNQEVYQIVYDLFENKREIYETLKCNIDISTYQNKIPSYLLSNLKTALCALKILDIKIIDYELPKLFGRFEKIKSNIIIDVGHNPLAASAIAAELKKENKKIILIYNSFEDKDYKNVLDILKPYIEEIQIIKCDDKRIVNEKILIETIKKLQINYQEFKMSNLRNNKYYLVFGSFAVVENFLDIYHKDLTDEE